jgi:hypothetical protein
MPLGEVVIVVCVVPLGGGDGEPLIGISPAMAEAESANAKAIAVKSRFMDLSPSV